MKHASIVVTCIALGLSSLAHAAGDAAKGKVAYAVVTYGGFLGMGAERRALPWSVLDYDTNRGGYVVSAADDILKSAPAGVTERELNDRAWGTRVYDHFGVPPYWM